MEETAPIAMHIGTGVTAPKPFSDSESTPVPVTSTQAKDTTATDAEKRAITNLNLEMAFEKAEKDRDGKFILTKKVKVDAIESLSEVPKRWPIPPKNLNVAYVVDLNNDKRWKEVPVDKKKGFRSITEIVIM